MEASSKQSCLPDQWRGVRVATVIPTYNEAQNIEGLIASLTHLGLSNLEIVIVDDGSPDGTGLIAERLARENPGRIHVLHRPAKSGLGRALTAGLSKAMEIGAEYVVQMDADSSHQPLYIPQMLGTLLSTDADITIGSRYVSGATLATRWPARRRLLSWFANAYTKRVLNINVRDMTAGYKLWRVSSLRHIGLEKATSNGYAFQIELHYLAFTHGLKIIEIPIFFDERRYGDSKISFGVQMESAVMPWRLRWRYRNTNRDTTSASLRAVTYQMNE